MREERRLKSFKNDHLSVSDQPGWTLILVGFFISFTIGYSIKSLLSPARIRPYIEQAAKQINKNMTVRIGPIEASLSKYGWPRLALILKDIRILNHNHCYNGSIVDISEIEVPLNFFSLLKGYPEINSVYLGEVELRMPYLFQNCSSLNTLTTTSEVEHENSNQNSNPGLIKKSVNENENENLSVLNSSSSKMLNKYKDSVLDLIQIKNLRIIVLEHPEVPIEFRNVQLEIIEHKPQWIRLTANLGLFKDAKLSNYLTNSKVFVEYNTSKHQVINSSITGNVREGSYKLFAQFNPKDHFLNIEGEMNHFPVFEILRLFPKLPAMNKISETSPIWLSTRFNLSGDQTDILKNNLQLTQVKVEGDPLDFSAEKIDFQSLRPLRFQKFDLRLKKLNLDVINRILTRPVNSKSLYTLGSLQGDAVVRSIENIDFSGEWKNLGFIISNKGERRVQMMNRLSLSGILREDQNLKLKLNKFEPANGGLNGEAYLQYSLLNHTTSLALELDELNLDSEIVKLLTDGGHVHNLRGQLNLEWKKNLMTKLKGFITSSEVLIESIKMNKVRFELASNIRDANWVQAKVHVDKLEFRKNQFEVLRDIFNPTNENLLMISQKPKQPNFIFNYNFDNSFNWKAQNLRTASNQNLSFSTTGRWTQDGQLSGNINISSKNKSEKYLVSGSRDIPVINKQK